jgi:hypothetical protein
MKRSRRHYGVGLNMPFREGKDPEEKSFRDRFYDQKYCWDRVEWLISKVCSSCIISGHKIEIDKIRVTKFSKTLPET